MKTVVISEEFSLFPMGRNDDDGPDNGQKFFRRFLLPSIMKREPIKVVFDGIHSCGSSFLDEAFNVMPGKEGISARDFKNLVSLQADGQAFRFYKKMAEDFISKIPR